MDKTLTVLICCYNFVHLPNIGYFSTLMTFIPKYFLLLQISNCNNAFEDSYQ